MNIEEAEMIIEYKTFIERSKDGAEYTTGYTMKMFKTAIKMLDLGLDPFNMTGLPDVKD